MVVIYGIYGLLVIALSTVVVVSFLPVNQTTPIDQPDDSRYDSLTRAFIETQISLMKMDTKVVFLGDSITQMWTSAGVDTWKKYFETQYTAWNYGIGGDVCQNVLYRLQRPELKNISPKLVVLLIGVNNVNNDLTPAPDIPIGVTAVIRQIKEVWPNAQILMQTIWSPWNIPVIDEANISIQQIPQNFNQVYIVDTHQVFYSGQGTSDGLHPNADGYVTYAEFLNPSIQMLTKQ